MIPVRRRRALLYVPGDDIHKIEKAVSLGVDCICLDMEDGVALTQKQFARENIAKSLTTLDFRNSEKLVRINPAASGFQQKDMQGIFPCHPDGVVIPKVEDATDIKLVSEELAKVEKSRGWNMCGIILIAIVESAKGIINLRNICNADDRLQAVIFGGEDLAVELNAIRTRQAMEIFHARSEVVLQSAAAGLQAIDMVFTDFRDLEWLKQEARQGLEMGFAGKQVIHPNQVEVVHIAYTPTDEEIREAREIISAARENQNRGKGAFALDGKMIDMPVVKRAANLLARAGLEIDL